jgi:hypothetical protein
MLGQVSTVAHYYQTFFGFPGSDLNLDCGLCDHVTTRFVSECPSNIIGHSYHHPGEMKWGYIE